MYYTPPTAETPLIISQTQPIADIGIIPMSVLLLMCIVILCIICKWMSQS